MAEVTHQAGVERLATGSRDQPNAVAAGCINRLGKFKLLSRKCGSQPFSSNPVFAKAFHPTDLLHHSQVSLN